MNTKKTEWCFVPVTVDDDVAELIHMTPPNQDANQKPEFRVTTTTLDLVPRDFDLYKPSLERMVIDWQEEKQRKMRNTRTATAS